MAAKKPVSRKTGPKKPSKTAVVKNRARYAKKTTGARGVYRRGVARVALWTRRKRKGVNLSMKKATRLMFSRKHRWSRRAIGAAAVGTAAYGVYRYSRRTR